TKSTEEGVFNCTGNNQFLGLPRVLKFWKNPGNNSRNWWRAPDGLFWICGKKAYSKLPSNWEGSCTLGIIQPGFFMLPLKEGDELGIPL
ncbi:ENR1 protein, partial [Piaya cayana]|nr:ENR1 protein [Piaya cayana]